VQQQTPNCPQNPGLVKEKRYQYTRNFDQFFGVVKKFTKKQQSEGQALVIAWRTLIYGLTRVRKRNLWTNGLTKSIDTVVVAAGCEARPVTRPLLRLWLAARAAMITRSSGKRSRGRVARTSQSSSRGLGPIFCARCQPRKSFNLVEGRLT